MWYELWGERVFSPSRSPSTSLQSVDLDVLTVLLALHNCFARSTSTLALT